VIVVGDEVIVKRKVVGTIAGYDDTHMPNHQNVIVRMRTRVSGKDLKWRVGEKVEIRKCRP
jgi:ribosomal protein S17